MSEEVKYGLTAVAVVIGVVILGAALKSFKGSVEPKSEGGK